MLEQFIKVIVPSVFIGGLALACHQEAYRLESSREKTEVHYKRFCGELSFSVPEPKIEVQPNQEICITPTSRFSFVVSNANMMGEAKAFGIYLKHDQTPYLGSSGFEITKLNFVSSPSLQKCKQAVVVWDAGSQWLDVKSGEYLLGIYVMNSAGRLGVDEVPVRVKKEEQ